MQHHNRNLLQRFVSWLALVITGVWVVVLGNQVMVKYISAGMTFTPTNVMVLEEGHVLELRVQSTQSTSYLIDNISIELGEDFTEHFKLEKVKPEPVEQITPQTRTYSFGDSISLKPGSQTTIYFSVIPIKPGKFELKAKVKANAQPDLRFIPTEFLKSDPVEILTPEQYDLKKNLPGSLERFEVTFQAPDINGTK